MFKESFSMQNQCSMKFFWWKAQIVVLWIWHYTLDTGFPQSHPGYKCFCKPQIFCINISEICFEWHSRLWKPFRGKNLNCFQTQKYVRSKFSHIDSQKNIKKKKEIIFLNKNQWQRSLHKRGNELWWCQRMQMYTYITDLKP